MSETANLRVRIEQIMRKSVNLVKQQQADIEALEKEFSGVDPEAFAAILASEVSKTEKAIDELQ